jgi:hypothetical protein
MPAVVVAEVVDAVAVEVVAAAEHAREAGFRLPRRLHDQHRPLGQLRLRLPRPDPQAVSRARKLCRAVHQVERGPAARLRDKAPQVDSDQQGAGRPQMSQAPDHHLAS